MYQRYISTVHSLFIYGSSNLFLGFSRFGAPANPVPRLGLLSSPLTSLTMFLRFLAFARLVVPLSRQIVVIIFALTYIPLEVRRRLCVYVGVG